MILYTHNDKLVKINNKFVEKYIAPPPGPTFDEVTIGTQTWMSKNLAIDDGQGGIYTQTVNYGQGNVVEHYYTFDAAVRVAESILGWHLPTNDEWNTLVKGVGGSAGTKLKSTYGWLYSGNGTDDYGFAALPGGWRESEYNSYVNVGEWGNFWTASVYGSQGLYKYFVSDSSNCSTDTFDKTFALTVRLVKDS